MSSATHLQAEKKLADLALLVLRAVVPSPDQPKVDHIWTPTLQLLVLRPGGRGALRPRDAEAVVEFLEHIVERLGCQVLVDLE